MTVTETDAKIRPMSIEDLDAIIRIDRKIRRLGKAITYEYLTTEGILTMSSHKKITRLDGATSYVDLITGDVSELLEHGLVAEVEGSVRAFILGGIAHVGEPVAKVGVIQILGVHPDHRRKGIATQLVSALCDKYRSKGITRVRIEIDQRDKDLIAFFERLGYGVGHRIHYTKTI